MTTMLRYLAVLALVVAGAVIGVPGTASAESPMIGYDVSYPQCGRTLPEDPAFAVVGVNGGRTTRANPCLAEQLAWAANSPGADVAQPLVQLYLNTGNPGEWLGRGAVDWPTTGSTPYGQCDGTNTRACSWQYGWERAEVSVTSFFGPAADRAGVNSNPAKYTWWLDVEMANTWQSGSEKALARNRTALEGMTAYLVTQGARVGIYSTHYQWNRIAGTVPTWSNLAQLRNWLAGSTNAADAAADCAKSPLVPYGRVVLTQFVHQNLDHNRSCV